MTIIMVITDFSKRGAQLRLPAGVLCNDNAPQYSRRLLAVAPASVTGEAAGPTGSEAVGNSGSDTCKLSAANPSRVSFKSVITRIICAHTSADYKMSVHALTNLVP